MKNLKTFLLALFVMAGIASLNASEYVAFVKEGKIYHLIDETGTIISKKPMTKVMEFFNGYASCIIDKKWHYIDQNGNAFTANLEVRKLHVFKDGRGSFLSGKLWGFMNNKGEVVIEPAYQDVKFFEEGKCWVKQNDKWFQIDENGKEVFSARFDKFNNFYKGIARVKNGDFWGYINEAGESIAGGLIYTDNEDFYNGKAFVQKGELWGVIDTDGKFLVEAKYTKVWHFFKEGYAFVRVGETMGAIDANLKEIIPMKYSKILEFNEGFTGALIGEKWHIYSISGKLIADGIDDFSKFQEGFAVIEQNEAYGILTTTGERKLLAEYQNIKPFVNGFALVKKNDMWGYIDINLKEVVTPRFLGGKDFYSDWTIVKSEIGLWGYINQQGEMMLQPVYQNADQFVRNKQLDKEFGCDRDYYVNSSFASLFSKAAVWFVKADMVPTQIARVKLNDNWTFINKKGEIILGNLENAEVWVNGYARFRKDDLWGVIDQNGKVVIEPKYADITEMTKVCL
jgi:hypothetical protein